MKINAKNVDSYFEFWLKCNANSADFIISSLSAEEKT